MYSPAKSQIPESGPLNSFRTGSQLEWGQVAIKEIEINVHSREDIPPMLRGLQYVYADRSTRVRWFEILEEGILPEGSRLRGRPGMELWKILVMGLLKQGLG